MSASVFPHRWRMERTEKMEEGGGQCGESARYDKLVRRGGASILNCVSERQTDGKSTVACINAVYFWRPSIFKCHCGNEDALVGCSAGGYCVCMCVRVEYICQKTEGKKCKAQV